MTTLAYDGRYLAADSKTTSSNMAEQVPHCKITIMNLKGKVGQAPKIHDVVIMSAGDYAVKGWVEDWVRYTGYKLLPPYINRLNKALIKQHSDDPSFNIFDYHKSMKPTGVNDSQLWVYHRGKLYEMVGHDEGVFTEILPPYCVGGSGSPYAMAAMVALQGSGKRIAVEAVRVASKIDIGSGGALLHYVDTNAKKLTVKAEDQ